MEQITICIAKQAEIQKRPQPNPFSSLVGLTVKKNSVSDPDPDWIRIQGSSGSGSRFRGLKKGQKCKIIMK